MVARFPIHFTGLNRLMVVLGMVPSRCDVAVGADTVHVRMAWTFSLTFSRASVRLARADHGLVWGWGVHGWRGQWLVNGSARNLVRVELDPPARARLLLVVPVRVRVLRVSVDDPAGLIAALT